MTCKFLWYLSLNGFGDTDNGRFDLSALRQGATEKMVNILVFRSDYCSDGRWYKLLKCVYISAFCGSMKYFLIPYCAQANLSVSTSDSRCVEKHNKRHSITWCCRATPPDSSNGICSTHLYGESVRRGRLTPTWNGCSHARSDQARNGTVCARRGVG